MTTHLGGQLIGVWTLLAYTESHNGGPDTHPLGAHPQGYLIYTADGFVSAHLMKPGRVPFSSEDWHTGTPAEYQQAGSGYIAYCGRFWADDTQQTVTHYPDVALRPNLVHHNQIRAVELHGDDLTLHTVGGAAGSASSLHWTRNATPSDHPLVPSPDHEQQKGKPLTLVTPLAAITALVDARNNADIDTALQCYDTDVTVVAQPGLVLAGLDGARAALEGFIALTPTFTVHAREILPTGQLALHYSRWTLIGTTPDGQPVELSGRSTDVLRRQPDGGWRLVIDNPYGVDILT